MKKLLTIAALIAMCDCRGEANAPAVGVVSNSVPVATAAPTKPANDAASKTEQVPNEEQRKEMADVMKDGDFRSLIKKADELRGRLVKTHDMLVGKMNAIIAKVKAETGIDDDVKIGELLAKNPEWISLKQRCADIATAIDDARRKLADELRRRLNPEAK